ncbi:hypothetical protein [Comamonas sp. SCN 65-56]|uniref:hypothetical protein n=1 Tax=Comamonas sp. SCN 65-56 TaxID=1660095 RepID=UPI00086E77C7|nr:hypothetical protein [Comamonas sp. SCN 65-56]ODS90387.1 MAG: hypothetical protein ABS45_16055 [Comamonas sp. SCN 65-56]
MSRAVVTALAPGVALAGLALLQPWLEQRMFTHMVVELPLLFAIGWWLAPVRTGTGPAWLRQVNALGLSGFTLALAISTVWMLPLALDAAVLEPAVGLAKVVSVVLSGWLVRLSLRAASVVVQSFFVINWAWMTATAGVLYQEAPQRLCSTYLLGDQTWTGIGLVALTVVVIAIWMTLAFRTGPRGAARTAVNNHRPTPLPTP